MTLFALTAYHGPSIAAAALGDGADLDLARGLWLIVAADAKAGKPSFGSQGATTTIGWEVRGHQTLKALVAYLPGRFFARHDDETPYGGRNPSGTAYHDTTGSVWCKLPTWPARGCPGGDQGHGRILPRPSPRPG
jgi:hypothetical protein